MPRLPVLNIDFTEGDQLPALKGALKNVDLTDCVVTLTLVRPDDVLTKNATLVDDANGVFQFDWEDDDIVAGLGQEAVIRLQNDEGLWRTIARFLIDVQELPA